VASPQPNSSFGDWWHSILDPGGNLEALQQEAQRNADLHHAFSSMADTLRREASSLGDDHGAWRGPTHDAFGRRLTAALTAFESHTQAYDLARQAHTDQARQKQAQQRQAEMLKVALVFLAAAVGVSLLASPVGVALLGTAAETLDGVAVGLGGTATAASEDAAATGLARLVQFGMRFLALAESNAAVVLRTIASADRLLAELLEPITAGLGRIGLTTTDGLKSIGLLGLVTVPARMIEKAVHGENPLSWTATDLANTAFIMGLGPLISLRLIGGPVTSALEGASIPEPLATALTFGASKLSGLTPAALLGSAAEGAFWNGAATAVGAFGINGEPLDDRGSWSQVALSTTAGYAAGIGGPVLINRFPGLEDKKFLGAPADVVARLGLAFPADLGIAWGTADRSAEQVVAPPSVPAPAAPAPEFAPKLVGGKKVKVRPGESLSEIAERDLGDGNLWPALQKVNPDVVDGHPDLIRPGDEIVEPSLPAPSPQHRRGR